MIAVDTSVLMAILLDEPEADACIAALEAEDGLLISAGTVAELFQRGGMWMPVAFCMSATTLRRPMSKTFSDGQGSMADKDQFNLLSPAGERAMTRPTGTPPEKLARRAG